MFRPGDRVAGEAVAVYNPDGALLINSVDCLTLRFRANFSDAEMEASVLNEMHSRLSGDAMGEQAYLVHLEGEVGEETGTGNDLRLQTITIRGLAEDPFTRFRDNLDPRARNVLSGQ